MSDSRLQKIIKSPYALRLVKKHVGYIVAFIFFIALLSTFIPYQVQQYIALRKDLDKLNRQINDITERINTVSEYSNYDLEELVFTLNTIYPSTEDRFSIFAALDNLQAVTGIFIENASSPFSGKSLNTVSIAVKASANQEAYRRFLAEHILKSGRFMTIDKISYNSEAGSLSFTANFHSKRVKLEDVEAPEFNQQVLDRALSIQAEVESAGLVRRDLPSDELEIPTDYSTKENPFE